MNLSRQFAKYRIEKGEKFRLKDVDPDDTAGLDIDKDQAKKMLRDDVKCSRSFRSVFTAKTDGPCSSFFRRWMRQARTV